MGSFGSKEIYEFKNPSTGDIQYCNIYVLSAASVYYIGFEDIGKGDISAQILNLVRHCISKKYPKIPIDNFFFFQWFKLDKKRGMEWVEFDWEARIPSNPRIKKYCVWEENPFIN